MKGPFTITSEDLKTAILETTPNNLLVDKSFYQDGSKVLLDGDFDLKILADALNRQIAEKRKAT